MKKGLRKQVLSLRDSLSAKERVEKSREIEERLFARPELKAAGAVMFFASFRSEADTIPMIRRALALGKRVILPKVKGGNLELFEIEDFDRDVVPGAWGIPEPGEKRPATLNDIDLMIIPGAAFDERGNRLGYGAGFYDRLLPAFQKATIALAFEIQIVPEIPTDPHDVPVQKIITEKRVIAARSASRRAQKARTH